MVPKCWILSEEAEQAFRNKELPLTVLVTSVIRAALERSGAAPDQIGHVIMGNVIPTEPRDAYLGRVASIDAGIPKETPAYTLNRLCGSGLQAIISAAQTILLGDAEITIGAGAESMSRSPYLLSSQRWGARLGNSEVVDYMLGGLSGQYLGSIELPFSYSYTSKAAISTQMQALPHSQTCQSIKHIALFRIALLAVA
jgi:acetyl-CoA C-acetyltransferase